jgi:hypothetical protein
MSKPNLAEAIDLLWVPAENAEWKQKTDLISLQQIREWIASDDIELLGYVNDLFIDRRFRIEPPISLNEYKDFRKHYCERCFRENPDGDWSDSRYTAGYDLCSWFVHLWDDETSPRTVLHELKDWIANLYKDSDEALRTCIVQATLEHLFERKAIKEFFNDWQRDPILNQAYEEACLWSDGGGKTPLTQIP